MNSSLTRNKSGKKNKKQNGRIEKELGIISETTDWYYHFQLYHSSRHSVTDPDFYADQPGGSAGAGEYLLFVEKIQPEVFVIENVKALLSVANGWFKNEIIETIQNLGYYVDCGVMNASHYGVPQARERAIFICSKSKLITLPDGDKSVKISVRDAISDLAYLESGEGVFEQDYIYEANSIYQKLMRKDSYGLYNHIASKHKQIAIDKLKMIPPEKGKECLPIEMRGKQKFQTTWGRLKWDEVSPTIDTRFDASSNGTNNHPFLNRAITPREAARIQSFDDKFIFYGSKVHIRKQIGNAVPPLMAKAIADQIYNNTKD